MESELEFQGDCLLSAARPGSQAPAVSPALPPAASGPIKPKPPVASALAPKSQV